MPERDKIEWLFDWERNFNTFNNDINTLAIKILSEYESDGTPYIFWIPNNIDTFNFCQNSNVNIELSNDNGNTILFLDKFNEDVYRWVASYFSNCSLLDSTNVDGLTALSVHFKRKNLAEARILLELGASMYTSAKIDRYGGAELDIIQQAMYGEYEKSVEAFRFLKQFGYRFSGDRKAKLIDDLDFMKKGKLKAFILSEFPG